MMYELNLHTMALGVATAMSALADKSDEARVLEQRFIDITHRYGALIAKLCFYYSNSTDDFDDLRQDCLINIWRGLEKFDGRSSLSTWLYRVCLNTCVSSVRKLSRQPEKVSLELVREVAGDDDDSLIEQLNNLYLMISKLPLVDRGIIMMWLDGCSNDEIGEVNGLRRNAVAVRIHRIKQRLSNTYQHEY